MESALRPQIQELIVVEGLHDKQAVDEAVSADVWIVGGDRIAHRFLLELERAAKTRGVIVLTDPDGPGERIRRRIEERIPGCKHAFLPKAQAKGQGRIGVEYASPKDIRHALMTVKTKVETAQNHEVSFTLEDLRQAGLAGNAEAAWRRQMVGEALCIGYANAKSFVRKLNVLGITREEWEQALKSLPSKGTQDDESRT